MRDAKEDEFTELLLRNPQIIGRESSREDTSLTNNTFFNDDTRLAFNIPFTTSLHLGRFLSAPLSGSERRLAFKVLAVLEFERDDNFVPWRISAGGKIES